MPEDTGDALVAAAALADLTIALVAAASGHDAAVLDAAVAGRRRPSEPDALASPTRSSRRPPSGSGSESAAPSTGGWRLVAEPEERARHLALAAEGPDAEVAAALDAAAAPARE